MGQAIHTSSSLPLRGATWSGASTWGAVAGVSLAFLGLFARLMSFPLRHDEQMYLPVGALLSQGGLYGDFGFNNLPNLPLLLSFIYEATDTDHYLLVGRLVIFAAWLAAAGVLALLVLRATGSIWGAAAAVVVLIANPLLIGPPGMLVTNNFLPVPFALLGLHLFIVGVDRVRPHWLAIFASGFCLAVAAGFKANFIFLLPAFAVAMVMLPRNAPLPVRLRSVALPLVAGGIVGALPVLVYFTADPQGFVAHVIGYHRGPHIAYWAANSTLDGEKIMSLGGKLQLAWSVWLESAGVLIVLAGAALAIFAAREPATGRPVWPLALTAALVAGAALVSFVPTPAFPQYFIAPLPFGIALAALLYGRLGAPARASAHPFLLSLVLVGALIGAPRLVGDLGTALHPAAWTGNRVHAAGEQIARALASDDGAGRIATLAPVYALEAGRRVYPELAAGPLVYRVGDLIPHADRRFYRMVSPTTLDAVLDRDPPAAILVGYEGELDRPFIAYALRHGYRAIRLAALRDRYGVGILYIRPPARG